MASSRVRKYIRILPTFFKSVLEHISSIMSNGRSAYVRYALWRGVASFVAASRDAEIAFYGSSPVKLNVPLYTLSSAEPSSIARDVYRHDPAV